MTLKRSKKLPKSNSHWAERVEKDTSLSVVSLHIKYVSAEIAKGFGIICYVNL